MLIRRKRRVAHRSPGQLFEAMRKSHVPEGGWTMQEFRSRNGLSLVRDMERVQKVARAKGARMTASKLHELMRGQVLGVVKEFERLLARSYGGDVIYRRGMSVPHMKVVVTVEQHEGLWAQAIEAVMAEQDRAVTALMRPAMQSVADDVLEKTGLLLTAERPKPGARRVMTHRVDDMARQVTGINDTTRTRLARTIARGIDDGKHPFEVMALVRDRVPEIATNRVPTIVRTEMGRVTDAATIRAMKDSEVVTHVSVMGCEAVEPGIPTFRGVPTCNIKNVPIEFSGDLQFHINHTGSIVASGFKEQTGQTPQLPLRPGGGVGTWEENGSPVPAVIEQPVPGAPPAPPRPPALDDDIAIPVRRPRGHLGRRTAPLTEEDVDVVLGAMTAQGGRVGTTGIPAQVRRQQVRDLTEAFGVTPDVVMERVTRTARTIAEGLGANVTSSIVRVTPTSSAWNVNVYMRDPETGNTLMEMTRKVDPVLKTAEHSFFQLRRQMQGGGAAKGMLSDFLDLYDHAGIETIELDANIDVGGYAWARYGFVPRSQREWEALRGILQERFAGMADDGLLNTWTDEQIDVVSIVLEADAPEAIRAVAALRFPTDDGNNTPVGKKLLLGRFWKGKLELTHPDTYAVFASYLGR